MSDTRYNAVANLSWDGHVSSAVHPADEQSFPTQAQARQWLRAQKCGGVISFHDPAIGDWRLIETLAAGEDAQPVPIPARG